MARGRRKLYPDGWTERACNVCKVVKHRSEFMPSDQYRCRDCNAARRLRRLHEMPKEQYALIVRRGNLRKYGITPGDYDAMFNRQGGLCAICRHPEKSYGGRLSVDHDHATGAIRELLCCKCNTALERMDNKPGVLEAFEEYLSRHESIGCRRRVPGEPFGEVSSVEGPGLW